MASPGEKRSSLPGKENLNSIPPECWQECGHHIRTISEVESDRSTVKDRQEYFIFFATLTFPEKALNILFFCFHVYFLLPSFCMFSSILLYIHIYFRIQNAAV